MKKLLLYTAIIIAGLASCSGMTQRAETAAEELYNAALLIEGNRKNFTALNREKFPGNGFFYILSPAGTVLLHPERALEGSDFSKYGFIKRILEEKNGCLLFNTGGRTINIFYRELAGGDILCFTFESSAAEKTYKECVNEQRNKEDE